MTVTRPQIETALDDLISNEEGMRFQGLATVLAKRKWPGLIACERKKDLGADAIALAALATDGKGKILACSVTGKLGKVRGDAEKVKKNFDNIQILIFATATKVTNQTSQAWAKTIHEEFGYLLVVVSREDLISELMCPDGAPLCRDFLHIDVPFDEPVAELLAKVREATFEVTAAWSERTARVPLLDLRAVGVDSYGKETARILRLKDLHALLIQCRRVVLEAPAGRGKTTTLTQLADLHATETRLAFLIDLPTWAGSGIDILQFIAGLLPFQARSIDAAALAGLNGGERFSFLLNGWNEISESDSSRALNALRELERSFPSAGIIVATRAHHIRPPLPGASRARLLPLSRNERAEYLTNRFGDRADALRTKLEGDIVLDDLTRTPLFLSAVGDIYHAGETVPTTKLGVLHTVTELIETSEEHRAHLQLPPLAGQARIYLEDLAGAMTAQGRVTISDADVRVIASSTSMKLRGAGQIAAIPEPQAVVAALCARHVLERQDYPAVSYRFEHQQFQEFFAASSLKAELFQVIQRNGKDDKQRLLRDYLNQPVWAEPIRMIADEIGPRGVQIPGDEDVANAGECLVRMVISVDPVFASELFRLCGPQVQMRVSGALAERLRSWYELSEPHRQCALSGMLATGSENFSDIILPLLSHGDRQTRLGSYRRGREVYLSSLGADWRTVVSRWEEEARADFVSEMIHYRTASQSLVEFALSDPSVNVKKAAILAFAWVGSDEELAGILSDIDTDTFDAVVRELPVDAIPEPLRPTARTVYSKLYRKSADAFARIRYLLSVAVLGESTVADQLKAELSGVDPQLLKESGRYAVDSALKLVQQEDAEWVSDWVVERIVGGYLWPDDWLKYVTRIKQEIEHSSLEALENNNLTDAQASSVVSLLGACAHEDLVGRVFERLCRIRRTVLEAPNKKHERECVWQRRLGDLFRAIPINVAVAGLADHLSGEVDSISLHVICEQLGRIGPGESSLRAELNEDLRQRLRAYLKNCVVVALKENDFGGNMKAELATALSLAGEPQDLDDLRQLIRADICRVRRGRATLQQGKRGESACGAHMSWSSWHVSAVVRLDSSCADELLLELLKEPEYEVQAASALVGLARTVVKETPQALLPVVSGSPSRRAASASVRPPWTRSHIDFAY